jgi:membrane protein required for colicin V production
MENISLLDLISIALIILLGIKGVFRGFIKEVFGLVGIIGGIYTSI